ncbi:MAG TPA: hypothetical protein VGL13_01175, partial [Polyangiaceae bacterium]
MKMLDLNKDDAELLNHVARVAKDLALTINAVVWRTLRQLRIAFLAMGSRLAKGARSTGAAMSTGLRSVRPTMARMASASARQSRKVAELTAMCAERTSVFAKPRLENAGDWTARSSRHAARALGNGLRRFAGVEPSLAAFELDRDDALLLTERGRASL